MSLRIEIYKKDVEELSDILYIANFEIIYGFIDGYVTINEKVYAIVFFQDFNKLCKIPIEKLKVLSY